MSEFFRGLRASVTVKLLFIGFLVLLLLIPMGMIESVIYERNNLYLSAKQNIMNAWGREQTVGGPVLTLPYRAVYTDDKGFNAEWKVLHLGRSYAGAWRNGEIPAKRFRSSAFGVNLFVPVGTYQKSTRAAKYAIMYVTRRLDWYRVSLDFGSDWPVPQGGSSPQATRTV